MFLVFFARTEMNATKTGELKQTAKNIFSGRRSDDEDVAYLTDNPEAAP